MSILLGTLELNRNLYAEIRQWLRLDTGYRYSLFIRNVIQLQCVSYFVLITQEVPIFVRARFQYLAT